MPRIIAILATPRTGTNYLCGLLAQSLDINGMYEIFHPDVPYGLDDRLIALSLGRELDGIAALDDKGTATLVRANSKPILDGLLEHETRPSLFKVFPTHLTQTETEKNVLLNSAMAKIIVDRSPLDVYISWRKASAVDKWDRIDTTSVRIQLRRRRFEKWYEERKRWYDFYYETLTGASQRYGYLNYAEIERLGSEGLVDRFIELAGQLGCELTRSTESPRNLLEKQDRNLSPAEKVDNWDKFERSFPGGRIDEKYTTGFLNLPALVA